MNRQMEEAKKFYSQKTITIATYFGGPLAAAYLVKKNYEILEQPDNAKKTLIIGIISTILIFAGIFSIPDGIIDKIPNAIIPAIYTGIIYLIVENLQGDILKNHLASGGEFQSGWKAAGIGAIALLITASGILSFAYISGDLSNSTSIFDAVTYDIEMDNFAKNESKALSVFKEFETQSPEYLIKEFNKGIVLWKENKEIITRVNAINHLPAELLARNELLLKYCDLRIQHLEIILKAYSNGAEEYSYEIEVIGSEINQLLETLNNVD